MIQALLLDDEQTLDQASTTILSAFHDLNQSSTITKLFDFQDSGTYFL